MKIIALLLALLAFNSFSQAQKKQNEPPKKTRIERNFNSQWTFNYFPVESAGSGYEGPGFNDSRWPAIGLPHTWNSYETTGIINPFTKSPGETDESFWWTGWGWYRKHFTISSDYAAYKVFIEFEGVQKYCKVWVNGRYAGDHKGGYGSFDFDITEYIKPGEDNVLAVAVSYLQKDEVRIHPDSEGPDRVSCGIYRNVTLVLRNRLYIPMQGAASHEGGTYITTPAVSEKEAIVNLRTWVQNASPQTKSCTLQASLYDRNNQLVQVIKSEADIEPGRMYQFNQTAKPVINPHLWSPEDPYLYTVTFEVFDRKELTDTWKSSFGIRSIRYDKADSVIYLNNKKISLSGVNCHPEYPWLGDAIAYWMPEHIISEMKSRKEISFIRTSPYPGPCSIYADADVKGILMEEDFTGISSHGFSDEEMRRQIAEMIRRDRNHPSIIAWGIGKGQDAGVTVRFVASEDSTRKIVSSASGIPATDAAGLSDIIRSEVASDSSVLQPVRISLAASHKSIRADRGTVFTVTANVVDSKGNLVNGAENTLRWSVSGPGKLVGPACYTTYADSLLPDRYGYYTGMPATNIIRSSGKAGKIIITVLSAGLASSSVEVEAAEPAAEDNIIIEPQLADEGRKHVASNPLVTQRLDVIPAEIAPVREDIRLTMKGKSEFSAKMKVFFRLNNPSLDTTSVEVNTLADLLGCQLYNNEGSLSAADYNYNAEHFNTCRLIAGYIARTKLPQLFKESLRKYYSDLIIVRGSEKNAGEEMNWLNWIPSGGVVVIVPDEKTVRNQKGVIYAKDPALPAIIKTVYPQFSKFSEEGKERALIFISKMNPLVRAGYPANGPVYIAAKGQPILIPDYKFISE